jgi:hypothetical protein
MFIVPASEKNRLEPDRGGMKPPGATHAAPTGLGRVSGRGVAINMSPRWGLEQAGVCARRPNERIEFAKVLDVVCPLENDTGV